MRRSVALLSFVLGTAGAVGMATPAFAETPADSAYPRAMAAGYKALTLCSAMFDGGRTQEQAEAVELDGIYPEYNPLMKELVAETDQDSATVTVDYGAAVPPRSASWR